MSLVSNILFRLGAPRPGRLASLSKADVLESLTWATQIGASGALAILAAKMIVVLKAQGAKPER